MKFSCQHLSHFTETAELPPQYPFIKSVRVPTFPQHQNQYKSYMLVKNFCHISTNLTSFLKIFVTCHISVKSYILTQNFCHISVKVLYTCSKCLSLVTLICSCCMGTLGTAP